MIKHKLSPERHSLPHRKDSKFPFLLLSLSFFLGCIAGSLIGSFHDFDAALSDFIGFSALESSDFFYVFFNYSRFHIAAFLLGTSFFGVIFLPILCCVRGYALSCTAATIISCYPGNGIVMALVILGVPAVLSLPCFFIMSLDGFFNSRRILNLVRGNSAPRVDNIYIRTIACLPVLAAGTIIEMKLIPYLVSLLK